MWTGTIAGSLGRLGLTLCIGVLAACDDGPTEPPLGAVQITTTTTGTEASGSYTVTVDGGAGPSIGPNATVVFPDVVAGTRTVLLSGFSEHCSVADNPRTVTVTVGDTTNVRFDVVCSNPRPVVTSVSFPSTISNDPLSGYDNILTVGFADPSGDIASVHFLEVSDPEDAFSPSESDLEISGQTEGTFSLSLGCFQIFSCQTGPVTVGVVLQDEAANFSEPVNFSFEVVD